MPTYQYACTSCGERLEVVQKFSDEPLTECPQCQGRLRKLFSSVGVVFKGSGFYKTDSRSSSSSRPAADAPAAEKPAEKTAERATEAPAGSGRSGDGAGTGDSGKGGKGSAAPSGDGSKVA